MHWNSLIEINRTALLGLVAVMLGMVPGQGNVARAVKRRVLEILLPSEACVRRLIVIATRTMEPPVTGKRDGASGRSCGTSDAERAPVFGLFDPRHKIGRKRQRGRRSQPGVAFFDEWSPPGRPAVPMDEDELSADALRRRIAAMRGALDDLPAQAQRLLRLMARRKAAKTLKVRPMRPGRPPGHRKRGTREVDRMLFSLNDLARAVLEEPPPDWVVADGVPLISP